MILNYLISLTGLSVYFLTMIVNYVYSINSKTTKPKILVSDEIPVTYLLYHHFYSISCSFNKYSQCFEDFGLIA